MINDDKSHTKINLDALENFRFVASTKQATGKLLIQNSPKRKRKWRVLKTVRDQGKYLTQEVHGLPETNWTEVVNVLKAEGFKTKASNHETKEKKRKKRGGSRRKRSSDSEKLDEASNDGADEENEEKNEVKKKRRARTSRDCFNELDEAFINDDGDKETETGSSRRKRQKSSNQEQETKKEELRRKSNRRDIEKNLQQEEGDDSALTQNETSNGDQSEKDTNGLDEMNSESLNHRTLSTSKQRKRIRKEKRKSKKTKLSLASRNVINDVVTMAALVSLRSK